MNTMSNIKLGVLLLLMGCTSPTGPENQLENQRARWDAQGLTDYTFDVARSCFCVPASLKDVRVTIQNEAITDVTDIATGNQLPLSDWTGWYKTIDGLFDLLQDAYNQNAHDVQVEFHPTRGYPTNIWIDYSLAIADEELGFTLLSEVKKLMVK